MNEQASPLFTPEAMAEHLRISRTRAYALIGSGAIESVKIGRARRITQGAIDRYIERLEAATTSEAS
jgi:excisionase family DNA binding protein